MECADWCCLEVLEAQVLAFLVVRTLLVKDEAQKRQQLSEMDSPVPRSRARFGLKHADFHSA